MKVAFGPFVLDRGRRALTRDGAEIQISPKAFRLLELLVEAAPEAFSRDALYEALWGETFVHEANLANLVSEIRGALDDDARAPQYIRTVSRFGYRFEAAVIRRDEPPRGIPAARLVWGEREYALKTGANLVGRDPAADIAIDLAGVSRRHATITLAGGVATIEDHGSKNGTFVRGARISAPVSLAPGETIRIGTVSLLYQERNVEPTITLHVED